VNRLIHWHPNPPNPPLQGGLRLSPLYESGLLVPSLL
jgi:hypothetical protein